MRCFLSGWGVSGRVERVRRPRGSGMQKMNSKVILTVWAVLDGGVGSLNQALGAEEAREETPGREDLQLSMTVSRF